MSNATINATDSKGFPLNPGESSVPIHPALGFRWSPSRFTTDREVEAVDLRGILEAARWAPSAFGEEPWRFIVARRDDPHRKAMEDTLMPGNAWAKRASVLIATMGKETLTRNQKPNSTAWHDTGLATSNLLAEATARSLITHPMGGFDKEALREAFGIPEDYSPIVIVAVGHYDPAFDDARLFEREGRPRRRRPLDTLVFGGTFGRAAEI